MGRRSSCRRSSLSLVRRRTISASTRCLRRMPPARSSLGRGRWGRRRYERHCVRSRIISMSRSGSVLPPGSSRVSCGRVSMSNIQMSSIWDRCVAVRSLRRLSSRPSTGWFLHVSPIRHWRRGSSRHWRMGASIGSCAPPTVASAATSTLSEIG